MGKVIYDDGKGAFLHSVRKTISGASLASDTNSATLVNGFGQTFENAGADEGIAEMVKQSGGMFDDVEGLAKKMQDPEALATFQNLRNTAHEPKSASSPRLFENVELLVGDAGADEVAARAEILKAAVGFLDEVEDLVKIMHNEAGVSSDDSNLTPISATPLTFKAFIVQTEDLETKSCKAKIQMFGDDAGVPDRTFIESAYDDLPPLQKWQTAMETFYAKFLDAFEASYRV